MILEGHIYCEGPDCKTSQHVGADTMIHGRLPVGWLRVEDFGVDEREAFCGWDCLMKRAARLPPPTIIPWDDHQTGTHDG